MKLNPDFGGFHYPARKWIKPILQCVESTWAMALTAIFKISPKV